MDGVRFLLRPGWVALTVGVVLFAIACFTLLAPWQFQRNDDKRTLNEAVRASFTEPAQPIEQLPPDAPTEWRQVILTGSYLPHAEVVARLRTVQGEPAFEVLTPLRLTSGQTVLINRGFLRPASGRSGARGSQVPAYPPAPAGEVTVMGRLRDNEPGGRTPVTDGGVRQVYAIDSGTVGRLTGEPLRTGYVQLNPGQPGVLGALPLPRLDAGPYLSYALQWVAFGVIALVGWVLMVRRELAERTRPTARQF